MRIVERIFAIIIVLAFIMKMMLLPASGLLLVIFCLTTSMFYTVGSFALLSSKADKQPPKLKEIALSIFSGIIIGYGLLCGLFMIQRWPWWTTNTIGVIALAALSLFALIMLFVKKENIYKHILFRSIPILIFILVSWMITK